MPQDRQRKRWIGPRQRVSKLPARRHQRTAAAVSRWKYSQAGLGQNSGAVMVVVVHKGGPLHQYTASAVLLLQNAREKKQFWHQSRKSAEIVAASLLAGEISLAASLVAGDFVSAHETYGRNRPDET